MARSVVLRFGALCIGLLLAVAPVLAQVQAAAGKAEDIKAMLLGTATWHADWTKPGDSGVSEIVFEARGDKIVKITPPTMSCEHDVTITTGVVKFDACLRQNVTLRSERPRVPVQGQQRRRVGMEAQAEVDG